MRFSHQGCEYLIEFERTWSVPRGSIYGVKRPFTTAKIFKITGPAKEDRQVIRSYTVSWNPYDRFSYEEGRKAALTMAMYDALIERSTGGAPLLGTPCTREFRTAAWKAYHTREGSRVNWKEDDKD
jgi:hypothetical protein